VLVPPVRRFPGTTFFFRGSALQHVWPYLLVVLAISTTLTLHYQDWGFERFSLTTIPFSLVGLALSIFLGFRNNACYDRWWEARKLWGRLINTTRSLARQTLTLVDAAPEETEPMIRRVIGYTHALRAHLRREPIAPEVKPWLSEEDYQALTDASIRPARVNLPIGLLEQMGRAYRDAWKAGKVHPWHVALLESSLTELTDIQGGCERIKNTPVPLSYTILTHRIVAIYCLALPFGIVNTVGSLTPIVVLIVSYAFLGLDSVGSQIEDPFEMDLNDLPLGALSQTITIDLLQSVGAETLPPSPEAEGHVLM